MSTSGSVQCRNSILCLQVQESYPECDQKVTTKLKLDQYSEKHNNKHNTCTRSDILGLNPARAGVVSVFFRPHSNPATVSECAAKETEPAVKAHVKHMDDGPNSGCSLIILA